MNSDWYDRQIWRLTRLYERLGPIGQLASLLLVLAVLFYIVVLLPQKTLYTRLTHAHSTTPLVAPLDPNQEKLAALDAFKLIFPTRQQRSNSIDQLMNITLSHGLALDNITYRAAQQTHDVFYHYFVEFSFNSTYPAAHDYLSDVLSRMPFVSIEHLEMSRQSIFKDEIKTSVKLGLHFTESDALEDSDKTEADK